MKKQLAAEFIGTFFLVLTVAFTGNPLAVGLMLAAMIYAFGPISGGHFNPVVTFAVLLNKGVTNKQAVKYTLVQLLAGFVAAVAFLVIGGTYFMPGMAVGIEFFRAYTAELIFTMALVLVILNVALNKRAEGNQYFGLAIGLTVFVGATAAGSISGGVFNPAVGVAPLLLNFNLLSENLTNIALYIFGPLGGALAAALIYKYMEK